MSAEERRAFTKAFEHLLARARLEASARNSQESWEHVQSKAEPELDEQGRPVLQINIGPEVVNVGAPAKNILTIDAPSQFIEALLTARLQSESQKSSPVKVADRQIRRDSQLLQGEIEEDDSLQTSLPCRSWTGHPRLWLLTAPVGIGPKHS